MRVQVEAVHTDSERTRVAPLKPFVLYYSYACIDVGPEGPDSETEATLVGHQLIHCCLPGDSMILGTRIVGIEGY